MAGLFAWTLLEYIIHGVLAHSHRTFVTPLHNEHHVDPRAVFAMRAWIPTTIVLLVLLTIFGMAPAMTFLFGIVAGFAVYEYLHYRIHFAAPASAVEARLRARHLAHHMKEPDAIFGVTTRIWDVVFGSEPTPERMRELAEAGASVPPLSGSSNLGRAIRSRIAAS
jgi:sterol desaturase/sphingolipid hydroxylase (fatty acid hydroxylase superfamily)